VPAVFTALADIFLGFLLTRTSWEPSHQFLCLLGASAGLYLSGMVFNDLFDLEVDRKERPGRPIPSGQIGYVPAIVFGSSLMLGGLIAAAFASFTSLLVALILAVAILVYDGGLKRTWLGPVSMGTCRSLNILLGASSGVGSFAQVWSLPQLWVAIAMGIYITGVTLFARTEEKMSQKKNLLGGLILVNTGLLLLAAWMLDLPHQLGWNLGVVGTSDAVPMLIFWTAIAFSLNRRAIAAILNPVPGQVQPTIGTFLMSIITINAMMIYFRLGPSGMNYAICTLALIIPAILLKRRISMT